MNVRKTFCENCKKQTITIIDEYDTAVCWSCNANKLMSLKKENDEEHKELKKYIKIFIIIVIALLAIATLSTLLNMISKWI